MFFVISGAVIYYNYSDVLVLAGARPGQLSVGAFLLKRFARLAPLYALSVVMTALIWRQAPGAREALNISLLFGFASPGETSTVTGGWSLGIEFVLYALFPVLLAFTHGLRGLATGLLALFALRIAFVETVLDGHTLESAWKSYTQPASFLFFFFGGMAVARVLATVRVPRTALAACGVLSGAILFLLPGASAEVHVLALRGSLNTVLAVLLVAGFFWSPQSRVGIACSRFLGDVSYGVYLLHPIAWTAFERLFPALSAPARVVITIVAATGGAWVLLRIYEKPLRTWIMARPFLHPQTIGT